MGLGGGFQNMFPTDNIYTAIKEHRLPVSREGQPIAKFLANYFEEYIESIKKASVYTKDCVLRNELYENLSNMLPLAEGLCEDIIKVYELYDSACMKDLYIHLNNMMSKIEHYLFIFEINAASKNKLPSLYRIRECNGEIYSRKDLFHIPIDKRNLIKPYRYSIAGYPCIYLANSIELCWFECGMPKQFNISQFKFEPQDNAPLTLIDFSIRADDFIYNTYIGYKNSEQLDIIDYHILCYVISHPLRAACSINVIDKNTPFIQEYIMPQLLLLWIRGNSNLDGIAYSTASSIEVARRWNSYNIVLPARDIENGYCNKLLQMFKLSLPIKCDISELFNNYKKGYGIVKDFTQKLENVYLNERDVYLYREILSLCKTFILIFNCIVSENYKDPEVLYQMTDTLNLMADIIYNNKDALEKCAIDKREHYSPQLSPVEITKEFRIIVELFLHDVRPVLFNFWEYAGKISCDTTIDKDSFEYV